MKLSTKQAKIFLHFWTFEPSLLVVLVLLHSRTPSPSQLVIGVLSVDNVTEEHVHIVKVGKLVVSGRCKERR